jgi:hypothetical protein
MPTLVSTQTFANGSVLSASALTNHVIDATPLATFISSQAAITSLLPDDEFLVATAGSSPAKKVTLSTLASHLPTGTTATDLAVTGTTTLTGALNANGNTILGDAAADTLTVNATSSFGAPVTVSSDTTLGTAAITGATWTRSTTTLTVTKTAHGLTSGNSRYFVFTGTTPVASRLLNGTYTVTVTSVDAFTVTVADAGDTVGTVTWFEKSTTINSTLTGPLQGNIPVNVANVTQGEGDEFLIRDSSDSGRLKTVSSFYTIKAYGNIALPAATLTTYAGSAVRILNSTTVTITTGSDHNIRTGDVLYIAAATGFAAGWYSATRVSATVFTVTTAATTALTATLNWYGHTFVGGNIYSIFGNNGVGSVTSLQVNFTNKPSASTYTLTLTVTTGSSTSSLIIPYCGVNSGAGSTGLNSSFIKTTNGFGVGVLSYAGGAAVSLADSFLNFTAIW